MDDQWRRWIAENLLQGASVAQIRGALVVQGCPVPLADAEIAEAQASPYLQAALATAARLEKRDWLLRSYGRLAGAGDVPVVRDLPAEDFFRDFYAGHRPVIVEGLVDDWPARGWTPAGLGDRFGDVEIEVQEGRGADPDYEANSDRHRARRRFGDVIARIVDGGPSNDFYLTANNGAHNRTAMAPLWDELGPSARYLTEDGTREGFLWIGPEGTVTPFHHDLTNNLLVQLVGNKRVTLVPSWETPRMRNHLHCYSRWDGPEAIAAADPAERPETVTCTIGPGQALFIPVGWWHYVVGLTATVGMSFTGFARPNDFHSDYRSYGAL